MTRIKAILLALRIEYHWWHIKLGRKQFDALYETGLSLESQQVQKLNDRISKHTWWVMVCEKEYRGRYSKSIGGVLF